MTVYVLVDFVSVPGLAPESPKPFLASSNLLENGESDGLEVSVETEQNTVTLPVGEVRWPVIPNG